MIQTTEYEKLPATVLHQLRGSIGIEEVKRGINEANEIISKVVYRYGSFNLIADPREHKFADLSTHKTWKLWLQSQFIIEKVNYTAMIVHDSAHTRAEKELLETEMLRFFFDFDEGINWLQNVTADDKRA